MTATVVDLDTRRRARDEEQRGRDRMWRLVDQMADEIKAEEAAAAASPPDES